MGKPDGHRWIRGYRRDARVGGGQRYALWEQQHGKPRRVGTARTRREANDFLGVPDTRHTWVTVRLPILTRQAHEQVTSDHVDVEVAALRQRLADHLDVDREDVVVVYVDPDRSPSTASPAERRTAVHGRPVRRPAGRPRHSNARSSPHEQTDP
jgi:hypothetical protein